MGQGKGYGKYVVCIDPLDGSSNIDVNISVGTIFGIHRRRTPLTEPATMEDFLQPAKDLVAAGYVLYGSSTMMVYSTGCGVNGFTYDPSIGEFFLSHPDMKFPEQARVYSMNESYLDEAVAGVKPFIKECRKRGLTARYTGALVADFHRNLINGGVYLYPGTEEKPGGKLRMLYEAQPLAFLAHQAGGVHAVPRPRPAAHHPYVAAPAHAAVHRQCRRGKPAGPLLGNGRGEHPLLKARSALLFLRGRRSLAVTIDPHDDPVSPRPASACCIHLLLWPGHLVHSRGGDPDHLQ